MAHRFIFICQAQHILAYELDAKLKSWAPGCEIIELNGVTEGAACTVLNARHLIDNDAPLMIANSDQYVDISIDEYLAVSAQTQYDGMIMTMTADDPKWSYAGIGDYGLVSRVVEKEVISSEATVGIYNFSRGSDFVRAADEMIAKDLRVNNEFYVAPVYNEMISEGARIGIYNIGEEGAGMYGLGIPSDLDTFARLPLSKRVCEGVL